MSFSDNPVLVVIGLGYVGLPLAVEFSKKFRTIGFDINASRIDELNAGIDSTLELTSQELKEADGISYTCNESDITDADVYIVTVPTPINSANQPDLTPLQKASELMGRVVSKGNIVIYESTVYPGCTEEVCVPIVEAGSQLVFNQDFFAGYSPERINPGDKEHRVHNIKKVTSGSTPKVAEYVDWLYAQIVVVGTHNAGEIRVAEAAKVIENTQRDINIALVNELSLIFNRLDIDTLEVLEAAGTKWNFLPFRPGLVGGHCISVDPYYLTHKAQEIGYHPEVILAGRRINDGMGEFVADAVIKLMTRKKIHVVDSKVLILGLAFKENCPDLRNTRVVDVIDTLKGYNAQVDVYDPWVSAEEAKHEYDLDMIETPTQSSYDAIILCVGHEQFRSMGVDAVKAYGKPDHVLFDVKHVFSKETVDGRL